MEQRCGTCAWWVEGKPAPCQSEYGNYGKCTTPMPYSEHEDRYETRWDAGDTCPCWKPKEEVDGKAKCE